VQLIAEEKGSGNCLERGEKKVDEHVWKGTKEESQPVT